MRGLRSQYERLTAEEDKSSRRGKKGRSYFTRRNISVDSFYSDVKLDNVHELSGVVADEIIEGFLKKDCNEVLILYSGFASLLRQEPSYERIFPLEVTKEKPDTKNIIDFFYEPGPEGIINSFVKEFVRSQIYHVMVEAKTSEEAARMVAMDSATNNAGDLIRDLTITFHRARQNAITKEISEIAGGAEALGR